MASAHYNVKSDLRANLRVLWERDGQLENILECPVSRRSLERRRGILYEKKAMKLVPYATITDIPKSETAVPARAQYH